MSHNELKTKIINKEARIAIIGLGYVGLPVACEFARAGFDVIGVDIQVERVKQINQGINPIEGEEPGLAELLDEVVSIGKFRATTNYNDLQDRDVVLIAVETPVDENNTPRYESLRSALSSLGKIIKQDTLVIIESTIAPGTMNDIVLPILSDSSGMTLNHDFYLGNCPERVMPGKLLNNLRNISRVVGGMTPETAETMVALYSHVVKADLDPVECVTAELVKTVENTYRDVQIAFANEVALICEAVGGDVWKVRDLVNKTPFRQMHLPGAGVGGHCIPKDPWLLAYGVNSKDVELRLIPAARAVNDSMPYHIEQLLEDALATRNKEIGKSRILVMGYAYLEDSDDTRNSPSETLISHLRELGANIIVHDPFIVEYQGDIYQMAHGCDAIVFMVRHKDYLDLDLVALANSLRSPIIIDGRRIIDSTSLEGYDFILRQIGLGTNRI